MQAITIRTATFAWLTTLLICTLGCAGHSNPVFKLQQPLVANNGMLYLYRPEATTPGIAKPLFRSYPEIFIDDRSVGTIAYNSYLPVELKPGKHKIRLSGLTARASGWEARDIEKTVTVEAGQATFMRLRVEYNLHDMNLLQPKSQYLIQLGPVSADDAQYEIRHTNRM